MSDIVITEAPIDALSLAAASIPAYATCGASNLRNFPEIFAEKTIICAFDLDEDPMTQTKIKLAMDRLKDEHSGRVVWIKPPGSGLKDWNDVLCKYGIIGLEHYMMKAGAKCKPPLLALANVSNSSKSESYEVNTDSRSTIHNSAATRPAPPEEPCYCCKSQNWWLHEMTGIWVCARCHPPLHQQIQT